MAQVQGYFEDRFASLRTLLQSNINSGEELGASLAVEIDGKLVIDLWGGYRDEAKTQPWQKDTVVNVWSTTKNFGSLAVLILVERGLLDLDGKVCTYWPEFAANGKDNITVRQLISHTSGVPAWEDSMTFEEYVDVPSANAKLAAQAPWWEPGTASGYHIANHGHLISELTRRTTGKPLKQFIAEDMAGPLHADFQLGLAPKDYDRVATIIPWPPGPPPPAAPPGSVMAKVNASIIVEPSKANTKEWRDAEVGAANGHTNGRAIARLLSPIVLDGVADDTNTKYLSPKTINEIFKQQSLGADLSVPGVLKFGTGYGIPAKDTYFDWAPTSGRVCGWGGWGGSAGIADVDRRMTIGYAMNKMHAVGMGSPCTKAYIAEIYKVLGVEW